LHVDKPDSPQQTTSETPIPPQELMTVETSVPSAAPVESASQPVDTAAAPPPAPPPPPPEPLPEALPELAYVIVNEAGASVYSTSPVGKEEFPNLDATSRGTISIGRRLQDPLSELVKIDPQHVGVGLYQHDVPARELRESLEGRADWDLIVVDAAATGHVISQLDAPEAIQELVAVGPIRNQTGWLVELLSDPALTALNVVTAPEEMPVNETIELVARARESLNVPLGVVIVNRVLPELFTHADDEVFDALRAPEAVATLERHAGVGSTAVVDAARLAVSMRRSRSVHLSELRDAVDLPLLLLPYLFVRDHGLRVTRMVAEALGQELT